MNPTKVAAFKAELVELVKKYDIAEIGTLKPHYQKVKDGEGNTIKLDGKDGRALVETGMYGDIAVVLPFGAEPLTVAGSSLYSESVRVNISAFNLNMEPGKATAVATQAATIDADSLKQRIERGNAIKAAHVAEKAAAAAK